MRGFPTETEETKMLEPEVAEPKSAEAAIPAGVKPKVLDGKTPEAEADPKVEETHPKGSKEAVLADLAKEREQSRDLKARIAAFEQAQQEAEKAKLSDIERAQAEANEARAEAEKSSRKLSVYQLAIEHGIKDKDDLELLEGIESEDARERFAKRIAAPAGPATPKPDPSQGAKDAVNLTDADKVTAAEKAGDSDAAKRLKAQQLGKLASNL